MPSSQTNVSVVTCLPSKTIVKADNDELWLSFNKPDKPVSKETMDKNCP